MSVSVPAGGGLTFRRGSFYREVRWDEVDAVVCYLYPGAMAQLAPIFQDKLKAGSVVVSICFAVPGWHPVQAARCRDMYGTPVYLYTTAD